MRVYLDHNATTPLRPEARLRWLEVTEAGLGNPSSVHAKGRAARAIIDDARAQVAAALRADEEEIFFTSGGTESDNLALTGSRPAHLATTRAEHSAVLDCAHALARRGTQLRLIDVDRKGLPVAESLQEALQTCDFLSIAAANNEVGSVADLVAINAILAALPKRPRFHTDAVQALGRIPVELREWGVDLASFSAHKVGGPPGCGVLWKRRGTSLAPLSYGGGQESELRPGTEDAAGIAASAVAIECAVHEQARNAQHMRALVDALWKDLRAGIPGIALFGPSMDDVRLPNTLCVRIPNTDGRMLVTRLDLAGVEASAGSACASGSLEASHVLRAMGHDEEVARCGLRLSVGALTSHDECKHAGRVLKKLFGPSHAT